MLVLYDTPAGYAVFKVLDEAKLSKPEKVYDAFAGSEHLQERLA